MWRDYDDYDAPRGFGRGYGRGAGYGRGYGRGYGMGYGRGFGRGYGRGYGYGYRDDYYREPVPEDEIADLMDYKRYLENELSFVNERLSQLKNNNGGE
jgi:hypothetical protein